MKVLLISHTCRSRTAGQQKAQLLVARFGVQLRLVVPEKWNERWNGEAVWKKPDIPHNPDFSFTPMKVRWPWVGPAQSYLHWYPKLSQVMEEFRPDVIDLWEEPWGLVSAHACWLRDRILPESKVVCETEQNICKRLPPPFEWIRKYVLNRADLMVARSTEAAAVLRQQSYGGPVEVVPNAVDADVFKPMDRQRYRADLKVSGFVVGYVGRLVEVKGLADLIESIAVCPQVVNLLIIGSGPYEAEMRQLVHKLNLTDRVRMIPAIPWDQLPPMFNAMDVLVVPSRTSPRWKEQFGRVIIEAHACGLPVVGSDSGAIPQVIGDGGIVVPERNPPALADAFKTLLADESRRLEMGQAGLSRATRQFTWLAVARQMRDIYARVLSMPNGNRESCNAHCY